MSKIDQIGPGGGIPPESPPKSSSKSKGKAFQELLDKAAAQEGRGEVAGGKPAAASAPPVPPGGVDAPLTPQMVAPTGLNPAQSRGMDAAQRALDLLERYAQALGDPKLTLKQVAPLLDSFQDQAQALEQAQAGLEPGERLHALLEEVRVLLTTQEIKFQRGDFVPTT